MTTQMRFGLFATLLLFAGCQKISPPGDSSKLADAVAEVTKLRADVAKLQEELASEKLAHAQDIAKTNTPNPTPAVPKQSKPSPYTSFPALAPHPKSTRWGELEPAKLELGKVVILGQVNQPYQLTVVQIIDEGSMLVRLDGQPEPSFIIAYPSKGLVENKRVQVPGWWKVVGTYRHGSASYYVLYPVPFEK